MNSFDRWEQEIGAEDRGRTLMLPVPMPRRLGAEETAPSPYRATVEPVRSSARFAVSEWCWGVFGGAVCAAPFVVSLWVWSGR